MQRDIDIVVQEVLRVLPETIIEQLKVAHPGVDDDGLWFFRLIGSSDSIQLESSSGSAPFLIEYCEKSNNSVRIEGVSVDGATLKVLEYLHVRNSR